jgi:hypothetical protein
VSVSTTRGPRIVGQFSAGDGARKRCRPRRKPRAGLPGSGSFMTSHSGPRPSTPWHVPRSSGSRRRTRSPPIRRTWRRRTVRPRHAPAADPAASPTPGRTA